MEKKIMRNYVIASYLVFWAMVMGICGTAAMVFHCPPLVMRILSNICAWAPTIVLLAGFRYFLPGKSIKEFYKGAFAGKVNLFMLLAAALLTITATLGSLVILSTVQEKPFSSYWTKGAYPLWATLLLSITSGPTGEESGWRGYLRPYLNSRYNFFTASVIQGLIWAFWHTILWFVDSDFMGLQLLPYVLSNVIVMTGLCFIINFFMEKNDNLIYGIVIHFCFNFIYCFLKADILFYIIMSLVYLAVSADLCLIRRMNRINLQD